MPGVDYTRGPRGERSWTLLEDWTHPVNGFSLTIPAGFRFDLASVPRPLWLIKGFAPHEVGAVSAPLIHDFIYRYAGQVPADAVSPGKVFTRREADRYFREQMLEESIPRIRRTIAWVAVRLAGWWPWLRARKRLGL